MQITNDGQQGVDLPRQKQLLNNLKNKEDSFAGCHADLEPLDSPEENSPAEIIPETIMPS